MIGARHYASLLRRGRRLYFGGDYLPASNQEWLAFKSPYASIQNPVRAVSLRESRTKARGAYCGDAVVRRLGAYIRSYWHALLDRKRTRLNSRQLPISYAVF